MSEKFSIKYSGKVPEGYDVSQLQYTYDFIYLVFKRGASIDGAIRGVANEYGLSEDFLLDYLVENKYLLGKVDRDEFSEEIKQYNTKTLKKLFIDKKIPAALRDQLPVICDDQGILGVYSIGANLDRIPETLPAVTVCFHKIEKGE